MLWYIRYISGSEMDQKLKIVEAEAKILIYTVSKVQPQTRYILGYMIPPSYGSILSQDSSPNRTPGENCYIAKQ